MKNKISLITLLLLFTVQGKAQINSVIKQIKKSEPVSVNQVTQNSLGEVLIGFDKQMKDKFALDGVKSQLVGDVLKIKAADSDFTKLNSAVRSNQAKSMMDGAQSAVTADKSQVLNKGVKTIEIDMVGNLSDNRILQTLKAGR